MQIKGRATDPTVTFVSQPELPQEEVLARLLFGRDLTSLSAFQAAQLASAVATLAGKGGDGIMSKLRKGFGLDDLDISTNAEGQTEVKAGLEAGQRVVLSGQFLIDSEASLRGLEARLNQEPPAGAAQPRYTTDAVIDALAGDTVTLTHPPIPALKWPEMQMDFRLPPKERQPRRMEVGDRLQIEFEMQDGDVPQITGLKVMPPEKTR